MDKIIEQDIKEIAEDIKKITPAFEGKSILITGGSGFIGGHILDVVSYFNENIFSSACKMVCLDNLIVGDKKRISHLIGKDYFKFIQHDISTPFSYSGEIDFIIHAASIASPSFYRQHPIETIDANVLGTKNLLQLALEKKAKSFLYLSSSEIYGDPLPGNFPTKEDYRGNVSCTGPRACYDEAKRLGETYCVFFHNKYNLPVKAARPFNLYGPGMRLDDKRAIPDFMNNVLHKENIIMYSDGSDKRTFCYIADAIKGFLKVLLSDFDGQAFNIGNDSEEISILELANLMKKISGDIINVVHKENPDKHYLKDNPQRRVPDLEKAKTLLNYNPKIDLKTGLKRSMEWYRANYNFN